MIMISQDAYERFPVNRAGTTLVEVMVACVILMIVALAGAGYVYQSQSALGVQSNKRIALEAGNARMEDIRGTAYTVLQGLVPADYGLHYLKKVGVAWQVSSTDPGETVSINGLFMPITTTLQYMDIDGGINTYDCFAVTVSTAYRKGFSDRVTLQTIYSP